MTIDEAKEVIRQDIILKAATANQDGDEYHEALLTLLIATNKYQKIEEIVKRYEHPDKEETDKFYWDIIEEVEDGNDIHNR